MNRSKKVLFLLYWLFSFCCNDCTDLFHSLTCGFFKDTENESQLDIDRNNSKTKINENNNIQNFEKGNANIGNKKQLTNKENQECILENLKSENKILIKKNNVLEKKIKELEYNLALLSNNEPIIRGLNNIGATCYMNATLQCLSNTKELTDFLLSKYVKEPKNKMANEYQKLISNLWDKSKNNTPYSPHSFKNALGEENPLFKGVAANDSKDLINFLLERLHQELNQCSPNIKTNIHTNFQQDQTNEKNMLDLFLQEFKTNFNSIISTLFYGVMETISQCLVCKTTRYNFQVYSFLEFPLQEKSINFVLIMEKGLYLTMMEQTQILIYMNVLITLEKLI